MDIFTVAMNAKLEALRLCQRSGVPGIANALEWNIGVLESSGMYIRQLAASMQAGDQAQQRMQAANKPPSKTEGDESE